MPGRASRQAGWAQAGLAQQGRLQRAEHRPSQPQASHAASPAPAFPGCPRSRPHQRGHEGIDGDDVGDCRVVYLIQVLWVVVRHTRIVHQDAHLR